MDILYNEKEQELIQLLAEMFEDGQHGLSGRVGESTVVDDLMLRLKVNRAKCEAMLRLFERQGIIEEVGETAPGGYGVHFTISPRAVEVARSLEQKRRAEQAPKDLVEKVRDAIRKHPIGGRVLLGLFGLAFFVTFLNQAVQLFKSLFGN